MKFGRRDDLRQLFHISWLNVNNVEALILDVEIPEVDPQVIAADKCFSITIYRNTVNVVRMGVGISSSRDCCNNTIMMRHPRKSEN